MPMLQGHGDDLYRFARPIRANFSSNVPGRVDLGALKAHLQAHLDLIGHYPEPEPYTLEAALAAKHAIDPAAVCATNGATEAIYLIAHAFARSHSTILQPTFSEYADACRLYHHLIIPGARQNLFEPSEGALVRKNLPLHQADAQIKESAAADGFLPSEHFSASEVKTRSCGAGDDWDEVLHGIQRNLMSVMSLVATPAAEREKNPNVLPDNLVAEIEARMDAMTETIGPGLHFLLPGGTPLAARLQLARAVCRRAERRLWTLHRQDPLPENILQYINRLSDLLFVMARCELASQQWPEERWQAFAYKNQK